MTSRHLVYISTAPHVVIFVPFVFILLGSSLAFRKEVMMFRTGSVPYRIDIYVLCAERGKVMHDSLRMAAGQERHPLYYYPPI